MAGDSTLIDLALEEDNLKECKSLTTPGIKMREEDDTELGESDKKLFQHQCGRLLYIAQDRPDVQYATKTASRGMRRPTVQDMTSLKRVYRHLPQRQNLSHEFDVTEEDLKHPTPFCAYVLFPAHILSSSFFSSLDAMNPISGT